MTLPSIKAVGIARRVGRRRRAKPRLIPAVILRDRWYKEGLLFLKKKKQKDFYALGPAFPKRPGPAHKSFLVLFFNKEPLAS
jgi:hypothetical protein